MYSITLQTNDTVVSSGDILGRLQFAASAEADGGASQLIGAGIYGMGEGSFGSSSNPASLVFITSADDSNAAVPRIKISEDGDIIPIQGSHNIGEPGNSFNTIYATGLDTRYIALASNVPADTTNKLYNDNGTLKFNGSSIGGAGGGGLNDLIDDTSPQLGANLDINTYSVTGVGNININGDITAEAFYGNLYGVVVTECRNDTGSTIAEGTPVYVAGYYSSNGKPLIAPADCANAAKMPAIGLLASELSTGSEGHVHVFGLAQNLPSAVTNGFSVGNTVYVDNGGGLTNVRPTGVSELVQNIGRVLKTGNNGRILVLGPGRSNDVPNSGHFEQLTVDGYTALAVDNGNVGIGTASPSVKLDVNGAIKTSSYIQFATTNGYIGGQTADTLTYQADSHRFWNEAKTDEYANFNTSSVVFNDGGLNRDFRVEGYNDEYLFLCDADTDRVGIGTASPSTKLHVVGTGNSVDTGILHVNDPSSGGTTTWIKLSANSTYDPDLIWHIAYGGTSIFRDLEFRTSFSSLSEVSIEPSGYLYVGSDKSIYTNRYKASDNLTSYNTAAQPAFTWTNDDDNGMFLPTANNIAFSTDGLERLRIDSYGNVGIGTASPSQFNSSFNQLVIGGGSAYQGATIYSTTQGTLAFGDMATNAVDGYRGYLAYIHNTDYMLIGTAGAERVRITSAGNVGIGTPSPSEKLDIRYPAGGGMALIKDSDNGLLFGDMAYSANNGYQGIKHVAMSGIYDYMILSQGIDTFMSAKSNGIVHIRGGGNYVTNEIRVYPDTRGIVVNENGADSDFRVEGDADQNLLFVHASGDNVAVGTNTPLDTIKFQIQNEGSTAKIYSQVIGGNNKGFGLLNNQSIIDTINTINGFYSYMYPSTGGNVSSMYHFRADAPSGAGTVSNQAGFYAGAGLQYGTNNYGFYGNLPSGTNNYNIYMGGSAKNYFNGDVGIGTASPSQKLDIRYPVSGGMALIKDSDSDDGLLFGDMAYSVSNAYQGIKHVGMTSSSDYMMISEGTNTLISARYNGSVYIRGGGNFGTNEIRVYPDTGGVVVNEQGANSDFRVEGDTDQNLIRTDASADRVGIGTASPSEKLDVDGTIRTRTGGIGHEDDGCYIAYPGGGTHRTTGNTTGYLKITLPVSWTNTMLAFDIDIYEYASQKIKKLRVGGYNYTLSTQWINTSAMMDSDNDFAKYKVHFGHDGTNCAIYISEIGTDNIDQGSSTVWLYPQISISNFFGGWSNFTMANWADGWEVGFTTTLGTINNTLQVSRPYRQHDTSYVFNEYGGNVDFRVEGDTDQNLLFADASHDRVGIGTNTPTDKLMVYASGVSSFRLESASSYAYSMIKHNSSTQWGYLEFNNDSSNRAFVQHNGSNNNNYGGPNALAIYSYAGPIVFGTNTTNSYTERMSIDTAGNIVINEGGLNSDFRVEGDTDANLLFTDASTDRVGIGTASPSYKLEVNGDIGLTDSGFYASPTGVMVGTSGWLYNDGQTTLSHGNFSDNGDAQNSSYVLRTSTTNDTFTTIQNNASNVILASNRTMMFTANIVARRTNGPDNAAYKLEGVLVNDGYEASILGTPVKTIIYESDSSWDVQAILSGGGAGASDYLLIQGKGAASKNINWVCKLDLLEVGGDISGYTEANTLNIDAELIP